MGLFNDLRNRGVYTGYERYVMLLEPILQGMTARGIPVSPTRHAELTAKLEHRRIEVWKAMQAFIPDTVRAIHPKKGYKKQPKDAVEGASTTHADTQAIWGKRWFCESGDMLTDMASHELVEERWVKLLEWTPSSGVSGGLLRYAKFKKHPIPTNWKSGKITFEQRELERLANKTKDPLYDAILEYRDISTMLDNHLKNWKPGKDGRVHPTFYQDTGTGQLGARRPNSMNAPKHKASQGDAFRSMIQASPGHTLLECVHPETRILMRDLTWKQAGEIEVGDVLWGFDEYPQAYASLRKTTVLSTRLLEKPCVRITTDKGSVICSTDHLWKRRSSGSPVWTRTDKLKVGKEILFFTQPWDVGRTYEGGWLEGMAIWDRTARILSIESLGEMTVCAIETTSHTFIAEGMLSHNCDYKSFHVQTLAFAAQDPDLLRLAKLDVHSFVTAHFLKLPDANRCLGWDDDTLRDYLAGIKREHKALRDAKVKHAFLGYDNGMGYRKLYNQYMEFFSGQAEAKRLMDLLDGLFPKAKAYRERIVKQAHEQGYLISRFGCIRWFWEVFKWDGSGWSHGEEHEAALCFEPQNTAHCHLKEAMLRCEQRGYTGMYRLINPMHDALLFEVPTPALDHAMCNVAGEMERPSEVLVDPIVAPIGLSVAVTASYGQQWNQMKEVQWRKFADTMGSPSPTAGIVMAPTTSPSLD